MCSLIFYEYNIPIKCVEKCLEQGNIPAHRGARSAQFGHINGNSHKLAVTIVLAVYSRSELGAKEQLICLS